MIFRQSLVELHVIHKDNIVFYYDCVVIQLVATAIVSCTCFVLVMLSSSRLRYRFKHLASVTIVYIHCLGCICLHHS